MINIIIEKGWKEALKDTINKEYFHKLREEVVSIYLDPTKKIYPEPKNIFNAFNMCPFDDVSVVILGQDPYHGEGQAQGLSFSVPKEKKVPPSLKNIFKEIEKDTGIKQKEDGDLTYLAKQGVFLLNSILTVESGKPSSHQKIGWEMFTDDVIQTLSEKKENLVFMLWGNYAKQKKDLIDEDKHLILTAAHPSPFSATNGFFGCKHFSKANYYLISKNKKGIEW